MSHPEKKLVVDLDGVIAGPKPADGSYLDCKPNTALIEKLQQLADDGWTIAIHTSRNVRSHDHNAGLIAAKTLPQLISWLDDHGVPYHEVWPGKPWCGSDGFYVDDRSVRPAELVDNTPKELLTRAKSQAFGSTSVPQRWVAIDARSLTHVDQGHWLREAQRARAGGARLLVLLNGRSAPLAGLDEALRRAGARWARFDPHLSLEQVLLLAGLELERDGHGSADLALLKETSTANVRQPHARHFNHVTRTGEFYTKTADHATAQQKLVLEHAWLARAEPHDLTPKIRALGGAGYATESWEGGSLDRVLLSHDLSQLELHEIAVKIKDLVERLRLLEEGEPWPTEKQLWSALYHLKPSSRFLAAHRLFEPFLGYCGLDATWVVNGERLGSPVQALTYLKCFIAEPSCKDLGGWHGDLCPGNIVMRSPLTTVDESELTLALIDPRGSFNGEDLSVIGDRRYDLGKLVHALVYGYDLIVEGWRDVSWYSTLEEVNVTFKLWDESGSYHAPNRLKLYDELVGLSLSAGETTIDSPQTHAIAGLQLLTCAPLHVEDPSRVVALIVAGMRAAVTAGWTPSS